MSFIGKEFFEARQLAGPDGRPLHLYVCDDTEFAQLGRFLPFRVSSGAILESTAKAFVLWAAERIRRSYAGGSLTWEFVFDGLGLESDPRTAVALTELGLTLWKRKLHRSAGQGRRQFLYSLLAEGGLPDALLARESGYSAAVLGAIADIERMGAGGAVQIARRRAAALPGVYRTEETTLLLAELAQAFVALRAALPQDVAGPAAEQWLDARHPGWAATLPLRLSEAARAAILRPALAERDDIALPERARPQRLLCRRADGRGWTGAIRLYDGMILPFSAFGAEAAELALRLVTEQGKAFRAAPDRAGWRLSVPGGSAVLALEPWRPWVLTAYADGALLGDAVPSLGLPDPAEAVSLWRCPIGTDGPAGELVPAAAGRTGGLGLWLLVPEGKKPTASDGVELGAPEPAPGGQLWPLAGRGEIRCGEQCLRVETASACDEADEAAILPLGRLLDGWQSGDGLAVYRGALRFLGLRGDAPGLDVTRLTRARDMRRVLGGKVVEWQSGDESLAAITLVQLPEAFAPRMREIASGLAEIELAGVPGHWLASASASAADTTISAEAAAGTGRITLDAKGRNPAMVVLVLSDPTTGRMLRLSAPWPSRAPRLIDPDGICLGAHREISLPLLAGWRGLLPGRRGAIQLQLAGPGRAVGFAVQGMQRLPAWTDLLSQAMALAGSDGRVNLQLVDGTETPRLSVGRYDWTANRRGHVISGSGEAMSLQAITLEEPFELRETMAQGSIDLEAWLGDCPQLWFVQGRSDRGLMRPVAWSLQPRPRSNRDERIARYQAEFRDMLEDVLSPGWARLIALIRLARQAGDCGALDQVQALPGVPAVAIVLLFRMKPDEITLTFNLETEAPFWWPLISTGDWAVALRHVLRFQETLLAKAGIDGKAARASAEASVRKRIAGALLHRPELKAHFGLALLDAGLAPVVPLEGGDRPILMPDPGARLLAEARGLVSRSPEVPQGVAGTANGRRRMFSGFDDALRPLLEAPSAVAEIAAAPAAAPVEPQWILQILALRHADPQWFDAALPLALQLADKDLAGR